MFWLYILGFIFGPLFLGLLLRLLFPDDPDATIIETEFGVPGFKVKNSRRLGGTLATLEKKKKELQIKSRIRKIK